MRSEFFVWLVVPRRLLVGGGGGFECVRLASPFIDGRSLQASGSAGHPASSIIFLYCCLDRWTITLASIIVLAIVGLTVGITVYSFWLVHFLHVIFSGYIREYIQCV